MKKEKLKKSNGITLIALVVTIIVLLILAGVSINMALGKNGIFEKAKETQKIQALAEEKEKLENARLAAMIDGLGEVTVDGYINELIKEGITTADKVTDNGDGTKTVITDKGYEVKVSPSTSGKDVTVEVKGDNTGNNSGSGTGSTTGNTETGENNTETGNNTTGGSSTTGPEEIVASDYTWSQSKTQITGTHKTSGKTVTLDIGDDYEYSVTGITDGYTGEWKVLGAGTGEEAGKLLIMTTSNVTTCRNGGYNSSNEEINYSNLRTKLNELCVQKCGSGARSVKVEDINRVTGYDPENQGDGTIYGAGNIYEYGCDVTCTLTKVTAVKNGTTIATNTDGLHENKYIHPDGRQLGVSGVTSITEKNTAYEYYPYSLTLDSGTTGTCKGIETSSKAYELLFANTALVDGDYCLANTCIVTAGHYQFGLAHLYSDPGKLVTAFCLFQVDGGKVQCSAMKMTDGSTVTQMKSGVRAVIPL